jgi:hypothetical protein
MPVYDQLARQPFSHPVSPSRRVAPGVPSGSGALPTSRTPGVSSVPRERPLVRLPRACASPSPSPRPQARPRQAWRFPGDVRGPGPPRPRRVRPVAGIWAGVDRQPTFFFLFARFRSAPSPSPIASAHVAPSTRHCSAFSSACVPDRSGAREQRVAAVPRG